MTVEEIGQSTDVDQIWRALVSAKASGDWEVIGAAESRMRDLAGHNDTRARQHRDPFATPVINLVQPGEGGS